MPLSSRTSSVAAGLLLGGSAAAELVHPVQASDGTVVEPVPFAAYLLLWLAGAALLVRAAGGLPRGSRAARTGRVLAIAGAVLLTAFAAGVLATGLAGRPLEASFVAFALGLLLSAAGAFTAGAAGRRPLLLVAGCAALLALLAPGDPWHDLGLLAFCLSWVANGAVRMRVPATA